MNLRDAWTHQVQAEDYELHMARIGQAEANASLVEELLGKDALPAGSRILIAGAGTGQILSAELLAPYEVICSDVNQSFLDLLRTRLTCEAVLDDIEDTKLTPGYALILLVLVLEHVDWRAALRSVVSLKPERIAIVIQSNPPEMTHAVSPGRTPPGTMQVFANEARPHLIPEQDLKTELAEYGFECRYRTHRDVQDGKQMIGLLF